MTVMAARGMVPRRVSIDPDELQTWCMKQLRPVDGEARADYAREKAREMD